MHEPKLAKGKARDDTHWQLGWWDLLPLVDGPRRPVVWSRSSVIYSAHPTQPTVLARHFPSSRQFVVSSPIEMLTHASSYEPPTVISISPTEDWLFAYFPGRDREGVGCLWERGSQLDTWTVKEQFQYAQGAGVVTAEWTSSERPWTIGEQGVPVRLPPRGPVYHSNTVPSLLLVTQNHQLQACFLPPAVSVIRVLNACLLQQSVVDSSSPEEVSDPQRGRRLCTHASIGLSYNEQLVIVATRSKLQPPSHSDSAPLSAMDLSLQLGMSTVPPQGEGVDITEWQQWGEESSIDLCLIAFYFTTPDRTGGPAKHMLRTSPLPSVSEHMQLTDLRFFAVAPGVAPPSPTVTRDPRRPVKDSGASEKGGLYLVASGLNFKDYSSSPKSYLSLYSLSRPATSEGSWINRLEKTRTFDPDLGTLAFIQPSSARKCLIAGFLDPSGTMPSVSGKTKETRVGTISVLSLPDLKTDDQWESTQIVSVIDGTGRDIPVGVAVSPNQTFICTISPSATQGSRTSVHSCPRRHAVSTVGPTPVPLRSELSRALVSAIYSKRSPSDVIHALTYVSLEAAAAILYEALSVLETYSYGLRHMWTDEFLGVVTEVYLMKSKKEATDVAKSICTEQWKTAHDIASVRALNSAFEDCQEGPSYDLEAIWQLVGISRWLIGLLEKLMKQCISIADPDTSSPLSTTSSPGKASLNDPWQSPSNTVFLFLLHPCASKSLHEAIGHIKRFREELNVLSPTRENSQIAKDVLMDTVDSSGVDINALFSVLDEIKATERISMEDSRKSLVTCLPSPSSRPFLREAAEKILKAGAVNRPKLFIKSSELTDGITRLSITDRLKGRDMDVISKGLLLRRVTDAVCIRCGGRSEIGGDGSVVSHSSKRWFKWEKVWASRCVCGGAWIRVPL